MQNIKAIGKNYRVIRPLFQINSYLYAQGTNQLTQYAPKKITMIY